MTKRRHRKTGGPTPMIHTDKKQPPEEKPSKMVLSTIGHRFYQVLALALTDGRIIEATVPAFIEEGQELAIVGITVSEAIELPEDMHFLHVPAMAKEQGGAP